jgi:hypothetical protein
MKRVYVLVHDYDKDIQIEVFRTLPDAKELARRVRMVQVLKDVQ